MSLDRIEEEGAALDQQPIGRRRAFERGGARRCEAPALLAHGLGRGDLAPTFQHALVAEADHLAPVRAWGNPAVSGEAGSAPVVSPPPPPA